MLISPMLRGAVAGSVILGALLTVPAAAGEPSVTERDGVVSYRDDGVEPDASERLTGTLIPIAVDDPDGDSAIEYLVREDDGSLVSIVLDEELPPDVSGGEVSATVAPAQKAAPARVGTLTVETAAAAPPPPVHSQRVYLAIGNGVVSSDAAVRAEIRDALDDWVDDADGFISDFTITATSRFAATCTTNAGVAWEEAAGRFPGVDFFGATGNHLILINTAACAPFGLGTVGSAGLPSSGAVWMNEKASGNRLGAIHQVTHHELGHNYGLLHANRVRCIGSSCEGRIWEYGNFYSTMGPSFADLNVTSLDSISRDFFGILDTCEFVPVSVPAGKRTTTGTWYLAPRGGDDGIRGLRVTDPVTGDDLWLDWRDGSGRDAGSFYAEDFILDGIDWPDAVTVQRLNGEETELLTRGVKANLEPAIVPGSVRNVDGVRIKVLDAVDGMVPIRLTVTATTGSGPAPKVSGDVWLPGAAVDRPLTVMTDDVPAGACATYEWSVDGQPLDVSGDTYTPSSADLGDKVKVVVRVFADGYAPLTKTVTSLVKADRNVVGAKPMIDGVPTVGQTLTVDPGSWKPAGRTTLTYQWQRRVGPDFVDIAGATGEQYVLTPEDVGRVRVEVEGTSPGYDPATRTSAVLVVSG